MIFKRATSVAAATTTALMWASLGAPDVRAIASSASVVTPPTSVAADCSSDVSKPLGTWLRSLPADTTVSVPTGACYQVDEGLSLQFPVGITIDGGTFENSSTSPPPAKGHGTPKGSPVFNVLSGSDVTFENLAIEGANPGGYDAHMAFAGGIELQGTSGATIDNVTITAPFGDGITLAPLRGGADHNSGKIKSPVTNVTISNVTISGAGRMGVTFGSVNGAQATNLALSDIGLDTFDVEADQGNEGAENVTIDGCTSSSASSSNFARSFFSNGGPGAAKDTGNITVENCTMTEPQGSAAILIERPGTKTNDRGPFLFDDDDLACGQSTSTSIVACVQVTGANVEVQDSDLVFPDASPAEAVYAGAYGADLLFDTDTVTGFGSTGTVDSTSQVTVTSGLWMPAD